MRWAKFSTARDEKGDRALFRRASSCPGLLMSSRWFVLSLAFVAGCSTAPLVDVCDYFKPGHLYPNKVNPYGGACIPQGGGIQGTAPSAPFAPVVPPPAPVFPSGQPSITVPTLPTVPPPGSVLPVPKLPPPPSFP